MANDQNVNVQAGIDINTGNSVQAFSELNTALQTTALTFGQIKENAKLAKQEQLNAVPGSKEYAQATLEIAKAYSLVREQRDQIKFLDPNKIFQSTQHITEGFVGAFSAASAAVSLFARKENDQLQKSLKQAEGLFIILRGLGALNKSLRDISLLIDAYKVKQEAQTAATLVQTTAVEGETVATVEATTATQGLNTAIASNPFGLIAIAIIGVIAAILAFTQDTGKAEEAQKNFNDQLERTNELLNLDLGDIKRNTDIRVSEAEKAGKAESTITNIKVEGLKTQLAAQKQANIDNQKLYNEGLNDENISAADIKKLGTDIIKGKKDADDVLTGTNSN